MRAGHSEEAYKWVRPASRTTPPGLACGRVSGVSWRPAFCSSAAVEVGSPALPSRAKAYGSRVTREGRNRLFLQSATQKAIPYLTAALGASPHRCYHAIGAG